MKNNTWTKRKIIHIEDGDTGKFANGEWFRLNRVNTPEMNSHKGQQARKVLLGIVSRTNGHVNVKIIGKGHYNRTLVELSNSEGSINDRLIQKGYGA